MSDPGAADDEKMFSEQAKSILKAELKRCGATYADLAEMLSTGGRYETEANLRNRISRGNFTASFFLRCLNLLGTTFIQLGTEQLRTIRGRARLSRSTLYAQRVAEFEARQNSPGQQAGDGRPEEPEGNGS